MTPAQLALLGEAGRRARAQLQLGLEGPWCDALPLVLAMQWGPLRQAAQSPHRRSTTAAVQAWLQVSAAPSCSSCLPTCSC